ncbi:MULTISPECIES: hypothetical protein [unclassified Microcoleus]|uniref:hypothetical protein n=1 Tax=unclassified Microcoleus TaxID=2642155 RepID=UPI002FD1B147
MRRHEKYLTNYRKSDSDAPGASKIEIVLRVVGCVACDKYLTNYCKSDSDAPGASKIEIVLAVVGCVAVKNI